MAEPIFSKPRSPIKVEPSPEPVFGPPDIIVKVYPYPDGKNVLLVNDKGAKIFHEIGGRMDKRTEEAYQVFLKSQK
jgi:hypothetical protein